MRLSSKIAAALTQAVSAHLSPTAGSELFLFGSRVDPQKKGGDIDLLLVTDPATKERAQALRMELRSLLREAADDQKVDLSVVTAEERRLDPFFSSIDPLVFLKRF